ncbi:proline dehydrogenase family protein [Brumimicrobium aurantiacum]|uniref:Proline dehydrogenase n=1 Tax=Brumimicrobium aurantiacum TaxID=1737063 RepID=A0A3E1EYI4_9FLAO|nr:proline dehydrogenase family protein [Brumimicrobium aurantiacum]RFC54621.1 proline dehydrogenase [Brumimicrobium aurantiacum]
MISFDNTEIAFKYKSTKDLKRAYTMFKLVGKSWLVQIGKMMVPIAFKLRLPIQGMIKATIFKQFCGGETIDDCDESIQILYDNNVGTILDYSVEGKTEEDGFDETKDEIKATITKAKGNKAIPFAVFKVTGLSRHGLLEKMNDVDAEPTPAEREEFGKVVKRVDEICRYAYESKVPIFIDAEESWIQDTLDRMVESMMAKYNKEECIVYNTFQMYRHDRLDIVKEGIRKARREGYKFGGKIVRGAYMEKERERAAEMGYLDPIQPDKNACDIDFNTAIKHMVENIDTCAICCGTHNEDSSQLLVKLLEEHGIEKNDKRVYFAQLLGMSDNISFNLAFHGYQVAKYVPYGPVKEVMPYLLRRADENTSVAGQTGRELNLISREWKRRKGFSAF